MSIQNSFLQLFNEASLISLADQSLINQYLFRHPQVISELTFSNIFCWRKCYPRRVFVYEDHLMMGYFDQKSQSYLFLQPIGSNPADIILDVHAQVRINWHRVHSSIASELSLNCTRDGSEDDFVYDRKQMEKLEGSQFATIRRKINKLTKDYRVEKYCTRHTQDCKKIVSDWIKAKSQHGIQQAHIEDANAAIEMLDYASFLPIFGIVAYVHDTPKAFVICEALTKHTGVIHFHKGDFTIEGLGARSLKDAVAEMPSFDEINFMQAKGDPGLTTWKQSWKPTKMIEKFFIPAYI